MLEKLSPEAVATASLAGEPITAKLTRAPGNGAPIGGLKVVTDNGWFAARPSGTENIYKIYAESFKDQDHLDAIVSEAQEIVNDALKSFDSAHQQRGRLMSDDSRPISLPPFPPGYRASGLLLHVTSLPSPYGIGDVGPAAMEWIDLLMRRRTELVAIVALGPDRIRQLSVSIAIVFCRQRNSNQPGLADRRWIVARNVLRATVVFGNRRRLREGYHLQTPVARERLDKLQYRRARRVAIRL